MRRDTLEFETAVAIFERIEKSRLREEKRDFIEACIRYAEIRVKYEMGDNEAQNLLGKDRVISHDALVTACNLFARQMKAAGEEDEWRSILGNRRVNIGDFASFVHCFVAVSGERGISDL